MECSQTKESITAMEYRQVSNALDGSRDIGDLKVDRWEQFKDSVIHPANKAYDRIWFDTLYSVFQKKLDHQTHGGNFIKS